MTIAIPDRQATVESIADALVDLRRLADKHNFKWPEIQRLANQQWLDELSLRPEEEYEHGK